jgi:hypothetical protein
MSLKLKLSETDFADYFLNQMVTSHNLELRYPATVGNYWYINSGMRTDVIIATTGLSLNAELIVFVRPKCKDYYRYISIVFFVVRVVPAA